MTFNFRLFSLFLFCSTLLPGCDDNLECPVPAARVNLTLDIYTTDQALATPGGFKTITNRPTESSYIGYGGILIIRSFIDDYFYAYDLCCPVELDPSCRLEVIDDIKAVCPRCGSEFDQVFYGSPAPTSGSAGLNKFRLRTYPVNVQGNRIYVSN